MDKVIRMLRYCKACHGQGNTDTQVFKISAGSVTSPDIHSLNFVDYWVKSYSSSTYFEVRSDSILRLRKRVLVSSVRLGSESLLYLC